MLTNPEVKPGDWVVSNSVFMTPLDVEIINVEKAEGCIITCYDLRGWKSVGRLNIIAVLRSEEDAYWLSLEIKSIREKRDRAMNAAYLEAEEQARKAIAKASAPAPALPPQPANGDDGHVG